MEPNEAAVDTAVRIAETLGLKRETVMDLLKNQWSFRTFYNHPPVFEAPMASMERPPLFTYEGKISG